MNCWICWVKSIVISWESVSSLHVCQCLVGLELSINSREELNSGQDQGTRLTFLNECMHHGYLSSHLLRVVFWTNSNTHNYWQVISLFPIATIHCKKKQHIGYNLATEWLPWLRTDCIKRSKGQLPSSSTTTIHWQHPWGNHLLSLQAWKLLTATLKCICNCNLTESCQCIVVLRWTDSCLLVYLIQL